MEKNEPWLEYCWFEYHIRESIAVIKIGLNLSFIWISNSANSLCERSHFYEFNLDWHIYNMWHGLNYVIKLLLWQELDLN